MSWKTKYIIGVIVVACGLTARAPAQVDVNSTFPSLVGAGLEGALPTDLEGKVLLVDFWASWCGPCKTSFPALDKLHAEFEPRGLRMVGVSVDERRPAFDAFLARMKPTFSVVRDGAQKLVGQIKVPTMPTSYLIDRAGRVRFVHRGFHEDTDAALRKEISQLLAENP